MRETAQQLMATTTPPDRVSNAAPAIECRGVTKWYGKSRAVNGVDLVVGNGEIVGLVGANGAGKTTLMRMICGLVRPSEGGVRVLGARTPLPPAMLARLGAALDTPSFYPWMTGLTLLRTLLDTAGIPDEGRSQEALERVGLGGVGRKKIRHYSMGMRQRLALATALVKRPEVLVLDEPMNGLDPDGVREMRALLVDERAAGTALLLSSHQMDEMQRLCDRVAVIDQGVITAVGPLDKLGVGTNRSLEDAYFSLRRGQK